MTRHRSLSLLVVAAVALGAASAAPRPPSGRNVKVLVELSPEALYGSMLLIAGSLGVGCDHCHSSAGFDRDDKPEKATARAMMRMVAELRRQPATRAVTCFTCHRGQPRPLSTPALDGDAAEVAAVGPATPSLDEVLRHNRRATGDQARLERLSTVVLRGHATFTNHGVAGAAKPVEIVAKPPDRRIRTDGEGEKAMSVGVSGTTGWRRFGARVLPLGGIDLAENQREARFAAVADVGAPYERLTVAGTAQVRGAPTIVVDAVAREHQVGPLPIESERLFFDASTGLLVRRRLVVRTALGPMPLGTDYSDFRSVDGVMLPFRVDRLFAGAAESLVVDEARLDVPVPDEQFVAAPR